MGIISAITNVVLLPESYGEGEQPPTKAVIVDELTNFVVYGPSAGTAQNLEQAWLLPSLTAR